MKIFSVILVLLGTAIFAVGCQGKNFVSQEEMNGIRESFNHATIFFPDGKKETIYYEVTEIGPEQSTIKRDGEEIEVLSYLNSGTKYYVFPSNAKYRFFLFDHESDGSLDEVRIEGDAYGYEKIMVRVESVAYREKITDNGIATHLVYRPNRPLEAEYENPSVCKSLWGDKNYTDHSYSDVLNNRKCWGTFSPEDRVPAEVFNLAQLYFSYISVVSPTIVQIY